MKTKKGFTLLELLIVIGILAILSTTIVIVINPAQLLKRARDSQRISDLNTMKTAIAYYLTEVTTTPFIGTTTNSYSLVASTVCAGRTAATGTQAATALGWIPVAFNDLSAGSPIGSLPRDPKQSVLAGNPSLYYVYLVGSTTTYSFVLYANMESINYSSSGDGDIESTDGGPLASLYEVGTFMNATTTSTTGCYPSPGQ